MEVTLDHSIWDNERFQVLRRTRKEHIHKLFGIEFYSVRNVIPTDHIGTGCPVFYNRKSGQSVPI